MADIADIGFRVDTSGIDAAKSRLEGMAQSASKVETGSEKMARQMQRDLQNINGSLQSATSFLKGFVGAFVTIRSARALVNLADTWSDLTSRVKVSIGANEDAAAVMDRLAKVARQTYSSMEFTADSFARNAVTLKALGKSTQEQLDYTSALNNALVVSGAKGQAFEQVQNALGKAMATGTLRGLELNTVLDRGSAVAEALAEELETDVLQLRRLGAEGKITGDVIFNALVKQMKELEATAETMPATVGDAFTILRNALLETVGFADQAAGSTNGIAEAIINLADIISRPEVKQGFADIAIGAVNATAEVAKLFGQVKSLADFGGRLAASKITGWIDPDDIELSSAKFRELHREMVKLESGERSWLAITKGQREARIKLLREEMGVLQDSIKNATIMHERNRLAAEDAENAASAAAIAAEKERLASLSALRSMLEGSGAAAGAVRTLADETENLYIVQQKVVDATGDVDAMIRGLAYSLASDATRALMDYEDTQYRIIELEMQWLSLGPMSEIQIAKLAELRALSAKAHERNLQDLSGVNARELMHMARGWDNFASDMAGAILDGSKGVKRWWKAMIDDMKHQLLRSGLLNLLKGLFPGAGGLQMAGGGAGVGFGQIIGSMFGGGAGGMGGSVLSGISTAISGGITAGLTGLGGLIGGGLGTGLVSAGMHIGSAGVFGGMASSFGAGMASMGSGSLMMGLGQMLPMIGAVLAAAAAIDKISGGKLFGTKYKFESASRDFDFGEAGVGGSQSMTEVRQRSLFRGRKWRTTDSDIDQEMRGPLEEFWNALMDANDQIARELGRDMAVDIPASFRQELDKDGNITKEIGTILGRQYTETWEEFAKRITGENVIGNIGAEASAIAERWRDDAETLLSGANFLLLAATDLHRGFGLLGDGTLTEIADLIEKLALGGESLSDAYARVAGSAALLDQALALSGVHIDGTREYIVTLAADIVTAAGGLERATQLWANYFNRFYSDTERAQYMLTQAQASAQAAFSGIGLDAGSFTGEGGIESFRALFEQALPTLSAEAIAQWLAAAEALGMVLDIQAELNQAYIEQTNILGDIASAIEDMGLDEWGAAMKDIATQQQAYVDALVATGMALDEATAASQAWADAAIQAARDAGEAIYQGLVGGLQDEIDEGSMTEFAIAMRDIGRWTAETTDELNAAARAAGRQSAAEQDLTRVHEVAAMRAAKAIAQLRAAAQSIAEELYGTPLSRLDDQIAALQEAESTMSYVGDGFVRAADDARKAMDLLLGSYSPLRSADKLPMALDALRRGETDQQTVLQIARDVYGSGRAYNEIFEQVLAIGDRSRPDMGGGGGGSSGVSAQMQALLDERERLQAEVDGAKRFTQAIELAQMLADLSGATGDGFGDLAESMGFALEQLATDLNLDTVDALQAYLDVLGSEQIDLSTTPTAGDIAVVDVLTEIRDDMRAGPTEAETARDTVLIEVRDLLKTLAERLPDAADDTANATESAAAGIGKIVTMLESSDVEEAATSRRGDR